MKNPKLRRMMREHDTKERKFQKKIKELCEMHGSILYFVNVKTGKAKFYIYDCKTCESAVMAVYRFDAPARYFYAAHYRHGRCESEST